MAANLAGLQNFRCCLNISHHHHSLQGRLDLFFLLLAGLMAANLALFLINLPNLPLLALVQGRLDLFFLLLAGLMAANLALYLWVAARYEYKAVEHVKRVTLPRAQRQVRSSCG